MSSMANDYKKPFEDNEEIRLFTAKANIILNTDTSHHGKTYYGILSWRVLDTMIFEKIEHIFDAYDQLVRYLRTMIVNIYLHGAVNAPFTYLNVMIYKVSNINPYLIKRDLIIHNGYDYMSFRITRDLLFFILTWRNGTLYNSITLTIPEFSRLHDISHDLREIYGKTMKRSILNFIVENKLGLDLEKCKKMSKKELHIALKEYYYSKIWTKYKLLDE